MLRRLADTELDLLTTALPKLPDPVRDYLRGELDGDTTTDALFDNPGAAMQSLSRKARSELLSLLDAARHLGLIDAGAVPEVRSGLSRIRELRDAIFRDSIRLAAYTVQAQRGLLDWSTALIAACQGLEIALDRFEPSFGYQFSTYAMHWIRHGLQRYRDNRQVPLRIPVHVQEALHRYLAKERTLWTEGGRPTMEAVLKLLGSERARAERKLECLRSTVIAHHLTASSTLTPIAEHITDPALPTPWDGGAPSTWPRHAFEQIEQALAELKTKHASRMAEILRGRLALGKARPTTLREIGESFGVSRERVRQLEGEALRRLKLDNLSPAQDIRPWRWRPRS